MNALINECCLGWLGLAWLGWFCSVCRLPFVAHLFFDCVGFALRMGQFALLVLHCALVSMRMRAHVRVRACVCVLASIYACMRTCFCFANCKACERLTIFRRFTNTRTGNSRPTFSHLHPAAEDVHDVRYQDRCANGIDSNSEQRCSMGYFLRNGCLADG